MIGIVVLAHDDLAEAMLASARHVLGREPDNVTALKVSKAEAPEALLERARAALAQVDRGGGVLLLTDIFGATPSNVAARLLVKGSVEGIAGVSLPMLVRAITYCGEPLASVVAKACSGGTEGVVHMNTDRCCNA